jgi:hypothetical protein
MCTITQRIKLQKRHHSIWTMNTIWRYDENYNYMNYKVKSNIEYHWDKKTTLRSYEEDSATDRKNNKNFIIQS